MKKLLVLCQNYPSVENPFSQPFIHYRLKEYIKFFDITVLSFAANKDYIIDGVKVVSEVNFKPHSEIKHFDLVISHAPNVRNHLRFILLNLFEFKKITFIFHGYEVIDIHKRVYDQETHYEFPHNYSLASKFYHKIKLPLTCMFLHLLKGITKLNFIFVSNQLLKEAMEDLKCGVFKENKNSFVVNNPINPEFYSKFESTEEFDFVCIRPFDDPKYGIDIFIKLAENNPSFKFHLYGKGSLPKVKELPRNLTIFNKFLSAPEMILTLKKYKSAILPTRWDSQGVLACELAAYGMPLLTSKLAVCEEFLGAFPNVKLVDNNIFHELDLSKINFTPYAHSTQLYSHELTTHKEIQVIQTFINNEE